MPTALGQQAVGVDAGAAIGETVAIEFGEFDDPGDRVAQALAQEESISLAEAAQRLKIMHDANRLAARLERDDPENFAGIQFERAGGQFRIVSLAKTTPARTSANSFNGRAVAAGIPTQIIDTVARVSVADEQRLAALLVVQLRQLDPDADFSIDRVTGLTTIYTENSAVNAALVSQGLNLPGAITIERGKSIVLTVNVVAGSSWIGRDGNTNDCTVGFKVVDQTTNIKGMTTAGHCDNNTPAEFNPYADRAYGASGGRPLTYVAEWITGGLDVQWHTVATADTSLAYFWDGTQSLPVRNYSSGVPNPNSYLCFYGKYGGYKCGYTGTQRYDATYGGYFQRILSSGRGPLSTPGDSGGPVVQGDTAWGWIHGYESSSGDLIFMNIQSLISGTNLRIVGCGC